MKYGGSAKAPKAPEKAPDAKRTYIFKCWDADTENITADTRFHPVYKAKARTYTVTFMDGKKTLAVQNVKYGSAAKAPKKPAKKADGKYVYKFAGWDADFGFITKDTVIHALFDAKENSSAGKTADQKKDTGKDADKDTNKDINKDMDKGNSAEKNNGTGSSKKADKDNNIQKNSGNNAGGTAGPAARGTDGAAARPGSGRKTGSGGYTADSGQKTGIGTGKGNSRTGTGNPETAGKHPLAGSEPSVQRPAAGASAQKQERQAGSRASSHTQGKAAAGSRPEKETADDNKTVQEKTEEKMDGDSSGRTADDTGGSVKGRRNPGGFSILLLLFAGAVSAAAFAWLYLRAFRKYRVRGAVCNADGNPVSGAHILLSGEKTLETCTDGQGKFCFDGIGKGIRQLEVWLDGDSAQLRMDIRVGEQDAEKAFRIRSSQCIRVGHALEKDGYAVNVSL